MRNIALKLMYNGTAYHGWQVQRNAVTVCGTLERAIAAVCGGSVHLTGCGRTDAGVHAEYYVANFRTDSRIPAERLPFAINTHTPEDIAVRGGAGGAGGFQRHRLVPEEGIHLSDLQFRL
jgi:tRNA pseudouridine38-40 synthase